MAIGGLLKAGHVGNTISKKITKINPGQGFTANLITGLLVTTASIHGMPVSTTHVSVGSIFGIGAVSGKMDFKVVSKYSSFLGAHTPCCCSNYGHASFVIKNFKDIFLEDCFKKINYKHP